jgi:hypothetical protein
MNANAIARHYDRLTPEERFRLILAASGRGDEAERDRLANAGERITLSVPDHSPYAAAFDELALLVFIELLEGAAGYFELFVRTGDDRDAFGDEGPEGEDGDEAEEERDAKAGPGPAEDDGRPAWQRSLELAHAAGFVLRTRADGWERFCERLNVPPFLGWEGLPGFDRVRRALALTEWAALSPEGFLRWLNAVRPAGKPERTSIPLTAEGLADATTKLFQERAEWWGG